jgi:hypothetical protein
MYICYIINEYNFALFVHKYPAIIPPHVDDVDVFQKNLIVSIFVHKRPHLSTQQPIKPSKFTTKHNNSQQPLSLKP